jgi:predicted metal-dependent hydrolase
MGLTVDRDGELILAAPLSTDEGTLSVFVREKRFWIYKKLAEKAELHRPVPRKEFIDGEGFLYLGRSYRLKLVDAQDAPLKLINGRFCLCRDQLTDPHTPFINWYSKRGQQWLISKVNSYANRMEVAPSGVRVQDLGYRWGSCGKGAVVYFHWKTMLLPRPIVEYVVVHELAHLHEPHHAPAFWRRVERTMPDYERRKRWLGENGISVEGLT